MSNNVLEENKTITLTLNKEQYVYLANMAKYLYVNGFSPSPLIEDFAMTALSFYVNSCGQQLHQKQRFPYPTAQPQPQYTRPQQPVQQDTWHAEGQELAGEDMTEEDMEVDQMFNHAINNQLNQEMNILKKNMGRLSLSGAGQNIQ